MKKILLIVLVLIVGCAKEPEPINLEELDARKDGYYTKDPHELYTGAVFLLHKSGEKRADGYIKAGKIDGKMTVYYENGPIGSEINYKDGELDGKWTFYNIDGSIKKVEEYKDGELVK